MNKPKRHLSFDDPESPLEKPPLGKIERVICETCRYCVKTSADHLIGQDPYDESKRSEIDVYRCHRYPKPEKVEKDHFCGEWFSFRTARSLIEAWKKGHETGSQPTTRILTIDQDN